MAADNKKVIIYFTSSGTTKRAAEKIQQATHIFLVLCIGQCFDIIFMCPQCRHTDAFMGVPHLDRGITGRRDKIASITAQNNVVDPIGVMFH